MDLHSRKFSFRLLSNSLATTEIGPVFALENGREAKMI